MKSVQRARANLFDLQPLEIRRFLTTASISSGLLTINGTSSGETITVNQFSSTSVSVTGVSGSFTRANFTRIFVNAGGGNDTILISGNLGSVETTISGGNGNDFITGGGGPDRISGDAGFDTANYSGRTSAVKVDLDGNADDGGSVGAEGDNVITDEVIGGSGNDSITGGSGADFLAGGAGGDTLTGGSGNDELVGSTGIDRHLGQSGDDALYAKNSDADTVNGGSNSDGTPDFDLAEIDGIDVAGISAQARSSLLAALQLANLESSDVLDPTYGGDEENVGLAPGLNSGPDLNWGSVNAAVVDSQGRTILVGSDFRGDSWDFVALRYDADGKWDQTFGIAGEAVINFDQAPGQGYGDDDFAFGVTVDADDNVIIVGTSAVKDFNGTHDNDFAVCRLDETGALDTVFGTRRYDIIPGDTLLSAGQNDAAVDVAVEGDKIVVVGNYAPFGESIDFDIALVRLESDGDLDTTFNGTGMNTLDVGNDDSAAAVALQTAGASVLGIVVGGNSDGQFLLARFTLLGELDTTFGEPEVSPGVTNGYSLFKLSDTSFQQLHDIGVNPTDGDIVAIGQGAEPVITIVTDGSPDFGADGILAGYREDGTLDDAAIYGLLGKDVSFNAVAYDPTTGGMAVAGTASGNGIDDDFVLGRFANISEFAPGFEGLVTTDFTPAESFGWDDVALGVGVLEDGKVIIGGYSDTCGDGCIQTSVARYGIGQEIEQYINFDDVQNDRGGNRSAAATFYLKSTHLDDGGNAFVELTNNNDVVTLTLVQDEDGNDQVALTYGDLVLYYDTTTTSITIDGKNGNDTIVADNNVPIPLFIFGGNGNDQLAGGNANDQINGGAGNDTVTGNDGNDVLIGEAGLDTMSGNAGFDILIGGSASDNLNGGAEDDILIGGTTAFDNDPDALASISQEWGSGGPTATRISNLQSVLKVGPGATVFDDNAKDFYTGGSGHDWFFRKATGSNSTRDDLLDNVLDETVTNFP